MGHYGPEEWWYPDGTLAANVQAIVFEGDQSTFASIFSDSGLTVPLANPTTTDGSGLLEFYAADGDYWVYVGDNYSGDSELVTLGPAVTGAVLSVNGQTGVVVLDATDVGAQPISTINAKGDLYAGTANDATTRRSVGSDGQVLTADSGDPTGMSWQTPSAGGVTSVNGQAGAVNIYNAPISAVPATRNLTASTGLTGGGDLSADRSFAVSYGTTAGTATEGNDSRVTGAQQRSTLTTKGDLYVATASATTTRQAVGSDGQVLTADSAQANGIKWATPASAPVTSVNGQTGVVVLTSTDVGAQPIATINAKGDLYVGTANDTTTRQAVGTDGQVLRAASGQATGLEYATLSASDVGAVPTSRTLTAGTGLSGGGDLSANRTFDVDYGTSAGTAAEGNDARIVNAIQSTIVDAKGDIIAATAADTVTRLAVGSDGQVLTADSAQSTGLKWATSSGGGIPESILDAKGDIIAATAADTAARLAVGSDGQYLRAASGQSTGLEYHTIVASDIGAVPTSRTLTASTGLTGGGDLSADRSFAVSYGTSAGTAAQGNDSRITGAIQSSIVDAKGDLISATANDTPVRVAVGTNNQLLRANSGATPGIEWATITASDVSAIASTLVDAKGDIVTATADNTPARLAVGTDNQLLRAASGQSTGLQWATITASDVSAIASTLPDAKGDLITATAADTPARLAVGTNGMMLTADSSASTGLAWVFERSFGMFPRSTGYNPVGGIPYVRSSKAVTLNAMYLLPFALLADATLTSIAFEVSGNVATAVSRTGIYGSSSSTLLPTGSAIIDNGTTDSSTTGTKTVSLSQALTAGVYWLAIVGQTAAPTLRHAAGVSPFVANATFPSGSGTGWNNALVQAGVSGTLPTIGSLSDTDAPLVGIKF